MIETKQEGCWC